jgi:histidinol-phosphate phosphatase family protein
MNPIKIDSSWCLFLDRDGVINDRNFEGYIENVEQFKFRKNAPQVFSVFSKKFNHIFVVTNQQGIAKKMMSERNLLEIHRYMIDEIEKVGGRITKVFFAKELKSDPKSTRKPSSAMALQAKKEFENVDFSKSIMVGDTDSDIIFGKNLGMITVRVKSKEKAEVLADFTIDSLADLEKIWEN